MTAGALSPGDRIGNCIVGAQIGAGGFGVVYEGRDILLDRRVAIKVLLDQGLGLTAKDRERLLREAKAVARLQTPYVVTIFHVASLEERGFALEMEFVDGGSLAAALGKVSGPTPPPVEPLPAERAVAIASQIASALRVAHLQGVVHGDLKPENVLLTADGHVKLVDFGLAHILGERRLESTGAIAGTPHYMAPEVIRGEGAEPASDVWSLGVLLYWMLSGRVPFAASSLPALFYAILESAAPPLPEGLPDGLRLLVSRCLAKVAAARPNTMTELPVLLTGALAPLRPAPQRSNAGTALAETAAPSVVAPQTFGRESEVAQIVGAIAAVVAGKGRTVLVTGDVGMGKSTVVRVAAAEAAKHGFRWTRVSLAPGEGLLRPLLDEVRRSLADDRSHGRPSVDLDSRTFGPAAPLLRDLLSDDRQPEIEGRQHTVWALQHLLQGLAREGPVALVVEGLHVAEAGEIGILRDLARRTSEHRVLILATARLADAAGGPGGTGPLALFADLEDVLRVSLAPMASEALYGLLEGVIGVRVKPEVARDVVARSGGNPLFALEIVRHLEATGAVTRTRSAMEPGPTFGTTSLPVRLVDLLGTRLRGLDEADREILEVAAVDGVDFDGEALAAVLERPLLTVLRRLQRLASDTGLVVPRPTGFRFAHALLRDVLYDGVAPALRREIHASIAKHLEVRVDGVDPERIGVHWEHADAADRAIPHFRRALAGAIQRGENERCVRLGPRAGFSPDALTAETVDECAELLLGLVRAYTNVSGHERVVEGIYDRLIRPDGGVKDPIIRMRATVRCAHNRYFTRGVRGIDEAQLLRAIDELPLSDDLGRAHYLLGVLEKFRGSLDAASHRFETASKIHARAGGSDAHRSSALDQLASVALRSGRAEEATRLYLEAAALSSRAWNRFNAAASEVNAVVASIASGNLTGAESRLDRAIRTLQLERSPRLEAHATVVRAQLQYADGRTEAAIATLDEVLSRPAVSAYLPARVAAQMERGHLAIVRGDAESARRLLDDAEESARTLGDVGASLSVSALRCQLACLGSVPDEMRDVGLRAVRLVSATREPRGAGVAGMFVAESGLYGMPVEVLDELVRAIGGRVGGGEAFERLVAFARAVGSYASGTCTTDLALGAARGLAAGGLGDRPALFRALGEFFSYVAARRGGRGSESTSALAAAGAAASGLGHSLLARVIASERGPQPGGG